MVCKRGLTRDACPGEAITRRVAGAARERGTTLALPPCSPPLPHLRDHPSRATMPPTFTPFFPPSSVQRSSPPVASSRLDDSTCQPAPSNPTLHRAPFPLSFSLLPLHFNRQHLSRPPSVAPQSTRRRRKKTTKKDEIIPLLLPHRRRRSRRRRGRATPRITSPASSLVLPLCGLLRALARTATGHCDYAA